MSGTTVAKVAAFAALAVGAGYMAQRTSLPPSAPTATIVLPAGLAPLNPARREIYDYYRLAFLSDGFPGRRTENGTIPHPIYGPYIISDYLAQHRRDAKPETIASARTVADAAIARMSNLDGALVFYYPPGLSSMSGKFYSGLTQARYLEVLHRLHVVTGEQRYAVAAKRVLQSLMIPVSRGGVLLETSHGAVIEEWPHEIGTYTLNGWLTAISIVYSYAKETSDSDADELLQKNLDALQALLPLYDCSELATSRYMLAGQAHARVAFSGPATIESGHVDIPGERAAPLHKDAGDWFNHIRSSDANSAELHLLLSRASFPRENVLHLTIDAQEAGEAEITLGTSPYNLRATSMKAIAFKAIGKFQIAKGRNSIAVPISWEVADLVSYPTAFSKTIGGKTYNVYHFIHIDRLRKLHEWTGHQAFRVWADRWEAYAHKWPTMPLYRETDVAFDRYASR